MVNYKNLFSKIFHKGNETMSLLKDLEIEVNKLKANLEPRLDIILNIEKELEKMEIPFDFHYQYYSETRKDNITYTYFINWDGSNLQRQTYCTTTWAHFTRDVTQLNLDEQNKLIDHLPDFLKAYIQFIKDKNKEMFEKSIF